jgi:hypothetical protein
MVKSILERVLNSFYKRQFVHPTISAGTRNTELENIMKDVAVITTAGVNVFNIKYIDDASKSTFFAMKELFDTKKIDHCIILDCENFTNDLSKEIHDKIWKKININLDRENYSAMRLSRLFNNNECRSIIVFDKFDSLYYTYDKQQVHNMIYAMAHDAAGTNLYTVQVNQYDKSKYEELIKINKGQKVKGIDLD